MNSYGIGFILILAAGGAVFWWHSREKLFHNISSGLGLALFLVSLPEARSEQKDSKEELKAFIGQMEQFLGSLASIHQIGLKERLWGPPTFALEIAAHNNGEEIFFYVAFPRSYAKLLEGQLHGYFPDAKIERRDDYNIFNVSGAAAGMMALSKESALLPIKTYPKMPGDPMESITSAFSKLKKIGDGGSIQIVMQSAGDYVKKRAHLASERVKRGAKRREVFMTSTAVELAKDIVNPKPKKKDEAVIYDEELIKLLEEKAAKHIFNCNIRIVASSASVPESDKILRELSAGFLQYGNPEGNSFQLRTLHGRSLAKMLEKYSFRVFEKGSSVALNVEEIASLFHFPYSRKSAPSVKMLKSRDAAPPVDIPSVGLLLGKSSFRGEEREIRITDEDRRRHFYMIGQTGTGKSVLMRNMIIQDIRAGKGVGVIDPHGDLIDRVMEHIPKERTEDVIYFNPGDVKYPSGLNMLEFDPRYPEQRSLIVNELVEIFNKLFNMTVAGGPMFEQYFRNASMLVMEDSESGNTLFDIERILTDKAFREFKLSKSKNIVVNTFWKQIAEKAGGDASLTNMVPYIVSKFDVFLSNEIMRPIILQEKSAFNVRDAMDQKKILLINLSKGKLGDLNSNLLGLIMVGKMLMAALSRVDISEDARSDFYLYIDEFQNVTTKSIATILSEARKYKLDLIITHQFIGQLEEDIKKAVFGNVGSVCSFRIGSDDAEYMEKQFAPVFTAQDLLNIDNYNAYLKLLITGQTSKPFNIKTIPPEKGSPEMSDYIKELSRRKYSRPREEVENEIIKRHQNL